MKKPLRFLIEDLLIILDEGKPMKRRMPLIARVILITFIILCVMALIYIIPRTTF